MYSHGRHCLILERHKCHSQRLFIDLLFLFPILLFQFCLQLRIVAHCLFLWITQGLPFVPQQMFRTLRQNYYKWNVHKISSSTTWGSVKIYARKQARGDDSFDTYGYLIDNNRPKWFKGLKKQMHHVLSALRPFMIKLRLKNECLFYYCYNHSKDVFGEMFSSWMQKHRNVQLLKQNAKALIQSLSTLCCYVVIVYNMCLKHISAFSIQICGSKAGRRHLPAHSLLWHNSKDGRRVLDSP